RRRHRQQPGHQGQCSRARERDPCLLHGASPLPVKDGDRLPYRCHNECLSIGPNRPICTYESRGAVLARSQASRFLDTLDPRPIESEKSMIHSTTILAVRHRDRAVLAGDGQVTFGQTVVKQSARKIRRLYNDRILAGFAGSAADSFALFARFESKLEQFRGNLERSAVELAKDWRSDRILRRLEAMLVVLDKTSTFLLSGNGDLI